MAANIGTFIISNRLQKILLIDIKTKKAKIRSYGNLNSQAFVLASFTYINYSQLQIYCT